MAGQRPHIRDGNSPLDSLAASALRRYGEFTPGVIAGDVASLFIEFANEIIDDVNDSPYRKDKADIEYYISIHEAREVHDQIIIDGLVAYFAVQQGSEKQGLYIAKYYRTLNRLLWQAWARENGGASKKFEASAVDRPAKAR